MMDAALGFQRVDDEFEPRVPRYLSRFAGRVEADDLTPEANRDGIDTAARAVS